MKQFFQGNNGKWSMMRLLCFIGLCCSMTALMLHPEQATPICAFAGCCVAGKWLQKGGEGNAKSN